MCTDMKDLKEPTKFLIDRIASIVFPSQMVVLDSLISSQSLEEEVKDEKITTEWFAIRLIRRLKEKIQQEQNQVREQLTRLDLKDA